VKIWPLRGFLLLFFLPPPTFYTRLSPHKLAPTCTTAPSDRCASRTQDKSYAQQTLHDHNRCAHNARLVRNASTFNECNRDFS
jgi:hypothetical protein